MELLSQIKISRPEGNAYIQLLHGDLTAIPTELAVDILAVSAIRGSYEPVLGTLMSALNNVGVSVAELAEDKDIDLLNQLGCWLSKPLSEAQQHRFNFRKILCFEPIGNVSDAETEAGNLFRGINAFAIDDLHNEVAMPVLATDDQLFPLETMLPILLDTAIFWLDTGLPLTSLKLVLHREDQVAKGFPIFENVRKQYELKHMAEVGLMSANTALTKINILNGTTFTEQALPKMEYALRELVQAETDERIDFTNSRDIDVDDLESVLTPVKPTTYDYFISYSHKHTAAVRELVNALKVRHPDSTIFYDRDNIPTGGLWIKMISDAIQRSKSVVCVLTPEYSKSDVCWDEFQCAYVMEKRKKLTIKTINFCNDADLPPMMAIYSYIDCTEGDMEKLKASVDQIISN
ncbi:toll/interleukin-1 receptor domain-containing protein [Spirosoma taeanense]|uniref:Toll/interleukin-1 receptor domain-containing protein n=1 Tax=Spirosoma taeanense TaxID=2735870 RepID=A0A6M5Y984_9BACT|nr:toll/interleukin-1 receptor domain-containing protein [Spirosoma taeanense]QJW90838.1 toll/interleukin-1 receptor domain-containing protein [Spirosoma taeanense]